MGDYVDKGPTSRHTVEFVKNLTTAFPTKVTAILGNHELELLRDRDARMMPYQRYSSYTHAVVSSYLPECVDIHFLSVISPHNNHCYK